MQSLFVSYCYHLRYVANIDWALMEPVKEHQRLFFDLFTDACSHALAAMDTTQDHKFERTARAVRATVVFAVLSLEAGANACLETIEPANRFRKDLDKLPFLSKYESFLRFNVPDSQFDRGKLEIQSVQEIQKLRNALIHPKCRSFPMKSVGNNVYKRQSTLISNLHMGSDPKNWNEHDAGKVLVATANFLNYYFINALGWPARKVCNILFTDIEMSPPVAKSDHTQYSPYHPNIAEAGKRWSFTLDCIGFKSRINTLPSP